MMKELINVGQFFITILGGFFGWLLGGLDGLAYALVLFVAVDYITGIMAGIFVQPLFFSTFLMKELVF